MDVLVPKDINRTPVNYYSSDHAKLLIQKPAKDRKDWLPFAPFFSQAILLLILLPAADTRQYVA
jgi:hypothetical protein